MATEPFGVLDRPPPARPPRRPCQQPAILPQGGIDTDRGDLPVRVRLNRGGGVRGLVRIDTDQHHRARVPSRDRVRGSAADSPTSRVAALVVTPLLSQAANGHRPGRHTQREPARRRQEVLESARPVSYGTLRTANPNTTPLHPYKSESTRVAGRWCSRWCRVPTV